MRVDVDGDRVIKTAASERDRERLGREARALRACAHPGVIPLVAADGGDPPAVLVTPRMPGGDLRTAQIGDVEVAAGVAAALATTVADLHDIGWTHGSIRADHVLLDDLGRPVLTGFGSALHVAGTPEAGARVAQDVTDLAALIRGQLPTSTDRKLVRFMDEASAVSRRRRPITARRVAGRIVEMVPGARLEPPGGPRLLPELRPGEEPGSRAGGSGRRPGPSTAAAGAALVAVAVAGLAASGLIGPGRRSVAPAPARAAGAAPVPPSLVTADRYVMSGSGASRLITVSGRWGCGNPRPAVLDAATGWVWVFSAWPGPGRSVAGRPVARRPAATGLGVVASRPGCDELVILDRSGGRQVVPDGRLGPVRP